MPERVFQTCRALRGRGRVRVSSPPPPLAESLSISRSYEDASASFATAPAKGGLRIHTASAKRRGFLIRRQSRLDAERDQQEAARFGVTTAELPPFNSQGNIYPIDAAREKGPPMDAQAWKNILDRLASETDYVVTGKRAIEIVLRDGGHVVFLADTGGTLCAGVISEPAGPELVSYLRRAFGDLYLPLFAITADGLAELTPYGIEKRKPA